MSILEKIHRDSIKAMKEGKKNEIGILRVVTTSLKNAQIQKGRDKKMTKEDEIKVLSSEVKKLKDAVEQFQKGGREDLAQREQEQLEVILGYLPAQLDKSEIENIVKEVINEVGATSKGDMGMVMGPVMKKVAGKADGKEVKEIVMEMLP